MNAALVNANFEQTYFCVLASMLYEPEKFFACYTNRHCFNFLADAVEQALGQLATTLIRGEVRTREKI